MLMYICIYSGSDRKCFIDEELGVVSSLLRAGGKSLWIEKLSEMSLCNERISLNFEYFSSYMYVGKQPSKVNRVNT